MTLSKSQRESAFGRLNVSTTQVTKDLNSAFCKARTFVLKEASPNTGKFPLDRLRRQVAHAMRLDVIYTPRVCRVFDNTKWPNSRLPTHIRWEKSPLWKTATKLHLFKSNRLCSLLHLIVTAGWRIQSRLVPLLVRMSTYMWTLSKRDFCGMSRKVISLICKRPFNGCGSSPDPLELFGELSNNPILTGREYRYQPVKRRGRIKPSRTKTECLSVLVVKLNKHESALERVSFMSFTSPRCTNF